MRLLLALVLAAVLTLQCWVAASDGRAGRSAVGTDVLSGELDSYLSDLKDFYTKLGRPRFGKRSTRVRRWRTVTSLGDVIHELRY
ncbi:uncharacterized protein LOC119090505 [Pollicipes pollicipes]|uniref:uncharacterized protein LOC119089629 n=1 Tax=Pollicipes pollicipes TaxID=41117 RepID=UPI001885A027|nr:uncharacterized protein LOC119089629 [Pollicipes pollicipes]XP_037069217.1 uncharacterized protein LOC119090505 [Pollicipes pollicipes]